MLGNLGFTEIAILVLILVLFFGAKRIPEIGASIGKGIREFKNSLRDDGEQEAQRPLQSPGPSTPLSPGSGPESGSGDPRRLSD
ncbi:MAG: Sec-independent protein translocase subunit TatA/TatB [Gemmatimonadales bacterium]